MKKLFAFCLLLSASQLAAGQAVFVRIRNSTKYPIAITENKNNDCTACVFCCNEFFQSLANTVLPGKAADIAWNMYQFCGVYGNIKFELKINDHSRAQGYINYGDPVIGVTVMKWNVDYPYQISGVPWSGSAGLTSNLYEYEITGDPASPITTTDLPKTGSRTFTEYLTIPAKGPQFPAGRSYDQLLNAEVLAPAKFEENLVDKDIYDGKTGKYTCSGSVGHARYTELPPAANGDKTIRIDFLGLPDDVPLVPVLNVAENVPFDPPPGDKPSANCLSAHYGAGVEPSATGAYTLTGGYQCKTTGSGGGSGGGASRKKVEMVVNYGNERFNRAVIFSGSNAAISYSAFRLKSAGAIRNRQQLNKVIIAH